MARFHFDVRHDDEPWQPDEDGIELANADEAGSEALALAFALGRDRQPARALVVQVRDQEPDLALCVRVKVQRWSRVNDVG
jgi:hypothetical protein